MQLQNSFNPMDHDPTQSGMGGLPVGKHPVVIKGAELKPTQAGDGGLVEFELEIIDGPSRGSKGAYRLNLYNKSEKAARIAHSQLSALCHVTGQFQLGADGRQLSVLFGIPFVVEVQPQKSDANYTEIVKVYDMGGNEPGKSGGAGNAAPQGGQQGGQQGGGNWGGQQQAPQGQQPPNPAAGQGWGGQPQQGQPQGQQGGTPNGGAGAWGGGQQQPQQPQQPAQGQGGGWNQGAPQGGQQPQGQGAPQQGGWQQNNQQGGGNGPAWGPQR